MAFQSVDPVVQEAARETAKNQAEKARLALEAQRIANQASQAAAAQAQRAAELKHSGEQAELERQNKLRLKVEEREFVSEENEKQRESDKANRMFEFKLDDLNRKRDENMGNQVNNTTKAYQYTAATRASNFPTGGTREEKIKWWEKNEAARLDHAKKIGELVIDETKLKLGTGRKVVDVEQALVDQWATLDRLMQEQFRVGEKGYEIYVANMRMLMENPEAWQNILMSIDPEGMAGGGFNEWMQEMSDALPELEFLMGGLGNTGGVQVPPGTAAESLPLYDLLFGGLPGKEGILRVLNTISSLWYAQQDIGGKIEDKVGLLRSQEGAKVRDQLVEFFKKNNKRYSKDYQQKAIAWLASEEELGRSSAFEEYLVTLQGVTKEDWIRGKVIAAKVALLDDPGFISKDISKDDRAHLYWLQGITKDSGLNPLVHPKTIANLKGEMPDMVRPMSLNPFGQEAIVSGQGNSGDVSLGRYMGHLAKQFNMAMPGKNGGSGMGDSILSIYHSISKYKDSGKDKDAFSKLEQELMEIGQRDGATVFQVFDAIADSWGNELRYDEAGDPQTGASSVIQEAMDGGWGLGEDQRQYLEAFNKAGKGLQDSMGEYGGIWNNAIGGGYGGTDSLVKGFKKAALAKVAASQPKIITGTNPITGAPTYSTQPSDDLVDQILASARKSIGGAFKGMPEEMVDQIAIRMLKDLDDFNMKEKVEGYQLSAEQLEAITKEISDLEMAFDVEQSERGIEQMREGAASQAERDKQYDIDRQKLLDEYLGTTETPATP